MSSICHLSFGSESLKKRETQIAKKSYMEGAYAVLDALGIDWEASKVAEILVEELAKL